MLKKENKIFTNLYNDLGWDIDNAIKRDDWKDTKNIITKGREWIINEVKISNLEEGVEQDFQLTKGLCQKSWFQTTLFA